MRVLIVSPHFPPRNTIASLRVGKFAEYLSKDGCSVRVVTSDVDGELHEQAWSPLDDANVLRVHDVAAASRARWRRVDGYCRGPLGSWRRRYRKIRSAALSRLSFPDEQIWWAASVARSHLTGDGWVPDIILASGPPFSTFIAARALARRLGVPWVADYRDLWTLSSYYPRGRGRRLLESGLEHRLIRDAAAASTVSRPLMRGLGTIYSGQIAVVMNGYEPRAHTYQSLGDVAMDGPLRVLYCGEIYPKKRDPSPLFQALADMRLSREEVRVEFYGASVDSAAREADKYGVGHMVTASGRVSHAESLSLQDGADILLLLLWNDPREEGVHSGKLFEYLGARKPILMLGYEGGVAADLIRSRQAGVVANDAASLAVALAAWLAKKRAGTLKRLDPKVASGLTRHEQTRVMQQLLMSHVRSRPS